MPETERFNYDAALQRLMELRFKARETGQPLGEEACRLERQIYAHVLAAHDDSEPTEGNVAPIDAAA